MVRNYLLISLRSLRKNRTFSLLNIIGLSIGMAACLLILQYISFERSYDQFHPNVSQIYRVDLQQFQKGAFKGRSPWSGYQFGPTIKDLAPGVKDYVRTHMHYGGCIVTYKGDGVDQRRQFFEEDVKLLFADQSFFDLFDFKVKSGSRPNLLSEPNTIVLTESMVAKYLPDVSDPIGELIQLDGTWSPGSYKITGVLEDTPGNSHLSFEFLISSRGLLQSGQYTNDDGWGWLNFVTYILLEENAYIDQVVDVTKDIYNDQNQEQFEASNISAEVCYTPLGDIHLRDQVDTASGVTAETLVFFLLIAGFIIVIAWLNYVNLSTAQAMRRAKEVGIRKVVGAGRRQLIAQFLTEASLINMVALGLAFAMAVIALPLLGSVLEKDLDFGTGISSSTWLLFGGLFVVGTLMSGFYPAFVLSGFRPAVVIKGVGSATVRRFGLRQILVIVQLFIGTFLISGTLTAYRQLRHMQHTDLGMTVEQVLAIRGPQVFDNREAFESGMRAFIDHLESMATITEVSSSDAIPGGDYNWSTSMVKEGQDDAERQPVKVMWVDENFMDTYEMELLAGRFHEKELQGEKNSVVVNETLLEKFDLGTPEEAIGQKIVAGTHVFPIIGVLKDYHWYAPRQPKEPMVLPYTAFGSNISVRLGAEDTQGTVASVRQAFDRFFPGNPFQYYFMDDFFDRQYKEDVRFGSIFTAFAGVAIVIACLGLFGLASFTLNSRVKEIGVRKVLGASVNSILRLIFKDYLVLIVIAGLVALPVVYLVTDQWLDSFATRIPMTIDLLLMPNILLMIIAFATIGYRSLQAATSNPVYSLKDE